MALTRATSKQVTHKGPATGNAVQNVYDVIEAINTVTQDGTGAVSRSIDDKLKEAVSVKDFGAVCDGTTNDTASVQAAVTYCLTNNKDLIVPGLCLLASPVNIDRIVDGANNDNYFTISSSSGGGFIVASNTNIFSTTLVNPSNAAHPVSQMVRFQGLKFEADVNTRVAYVLTENKFLRILFESCNFRKIKALNAPDGKFIQSIYFQNCQARRWSGTFLTSKEITFDLKVMNCLMEAGGDAFDIDFPVGTSFEGACIEGMANYAIKYVGGYGLNISGCYFEQNGTGNPSGCTIDGSGAVGLVASETVSIIGNYFSGDSGLPTKPEIRWGDTQASCVSMGNHCTTTLHNFGSGSRVSVVNDYAGTSLANTEVRQYLPAANSQTFGGVISPDYIAGRGGLLRLRSMQSFTPSTRGLTIDENGSLGFGTDTPLAETHTHLTNTVKTRAYLSNGTLGPTFGGYFSGYSVSGGGGFAAIGTVQGGTSTEALIINESNNVYPATDNAKSLGVSSNRWSVIYAGTGTINTSDEREKTVLESLSATETSCALELKQNIKKFKFLDSVERKGANARIHFGVGAQTVRQVFEKHGLNAENYAVFCYDEWQEQRDADGTVITPAGNRYGVRYEELLAFIIAAM